MAGIGIVFGSAHHLTSSGRAGLNRIALTHNCLTCAAFAIEFVGILLTAIATGVVYHYVGYGYPGSLQTYFSIGSIAALAYCLAFLVRDEYKIESLVDGCRTPGHLVLAWSLVFPALAVSGFLTQSKQTYSRGWLVLLYFAGSFGVVLLNAAIARGLGHLISRGWVRARRLMVVATESDLDTLEQGIARPDPGFSVAARVIIEKAGPDPDEIERALDVAVANARVLGIDDVFISDALSSQAFLERTVEAFGALPVSVHLSAGGLIERCKHARVLRFSTAGPREATTKRCFDIVASAAALVLLSPLFAILALLIKCDGPGPVFFKQRRRSYNTVDFRIWKFRTMKMLEDGDTVPQITERDARITYIGAFLRRFSLDELPQLINVLKGEMSLVGPHPHAVAHDRLFERRIEGCPRRLNVKPGTTGWTEVDGFRGTTDTNDAMQQRLEQDIFYIENCSLGFDLYILLLTLASSKANSNGIGRNG